MAAPVGVVVVTMIVIGGMRARSACTSAEAACASPTETACTQRLGPAAGSAATKPRRSRQRSQ